MAHHRIWWKWLAGIPIIAGLNIGLPALITGQVWWFVHAWTDMVFVLVLTIIWVVGLALYPAGHGLRWRGTLTRRLLGIGLLLAMGVSIYERVHGPAAARPVEWSLAGIGLFVLACAVGGLAARALGASYSPDLDTRTGQSLVTHGVYRFIRHPMYTGLLLVTLGMPLILRSLWGMGIGIAVIVPALWLRIRDEEQRLLATFGDAYREVQARTRLLIPFLF